MERAPIEQIYTWLGGLTQMRPQVVALRGERLDWRSMGAVRICLYPDYQIAQLGLTYRGLADKSGQVDKSGLWYSVFTCPPPEGRYAHMLRRPKAWRMAAEQASQLGLPMGVCVLDYNTDDAKKRAVTLYLLPGVPPRTFVRKLLEALDR